MSIIAIVAAFVLHADTAVIVGGTSATEASYIVNHPIAQEYDNVVVVPYPGTILFPWYEESVRIGKENLNNTVNSVQGDVTVIGFSQGARVAGDYLADTQRSNVDGVLISDPRGVGGVETMIPGLSGPRNNDFNVPVNTICHPLDGVCNWKPHDIVGSIVGYLQYHDSYFN